MSKGETKEHLTKKQMEGLIAHRERLYAERNGSFSRILFGERAEKRDKRVHRIEVEIDAINHTLEGIRLPPDQVLPSPLSEAFEESKHHIEWVVTHEHGEMGYLEWDQVSAYSPGELLADLRIVQRRDKLLLDEKNLIVVIQFRDKESWGWEHEWRIPYPVFLYYCVDKDTELSLRWA